MNQTSNDNLPSSPTEDYEGPRKRQKLDTINSSTLNYTDNVSKWERIGIERELRALSTALSNTEATTTQLRKMKKEMDKVFDEEERVLEIQAIVKRETIEQLKVRLETTAEAGAPQATLEAEIAPIEIRITEKMRTLFPKNTTINKNKLFLKLEHIFTENMETQELDIQNSELEEVNIETEKYDSVSAEKILWEKEKQRTNELGEQLQSAKDIISTLREALKGQLHFEEKISSMQKKLDDAGAVGQKVVNRKSKNSRLSVASKHETFHCQQPEAIWVQEGRKTRAYVDDMQQENRRCQQKRKKSKGMRENSTRRKKNIQEPDLQLSEDEFPSDQTDNEDPLKKGPDEGESNSREQSEDIDKEASEVEQSQMTSKIMVGNYWVQPSNLKFFKIAWKKHYRQGRSRKFICNQCFYKTDKRLGMQDHIWDKHYGGHFKCPHCLVCRVSRYSVLRHLKRHHPNMFLQ